MKRIVTLMLAFAMVFGAVANSVAADISAKGVFMMNYQWTDNANFSDGEKDATSEDEFLAQQRFRSQIDIAASENLSGTVYFEIDQQWGRSDAGAGKNTGGGVGADGVNVETKRAYIDFVVPGTALDVRMGIQGMSLPSATFGSPILSDDAAGIVARYKVNDMVGIDAIWVRPYDTTSTANSSTGNDEMDVLALVAGIDLDGMKITPYVAYSMIGSGVSNAGLQSLWADLKNTAPGRYSRFSVNSTAAGAAAQGSLDTVYNGTDNLESSTAWWLGLSYELDMFDPFVLGFDAVYGSVNAGDETYRTARGNTTGLNGTQANKYVTDDEINDRAGWMVSADLSFKMDMVTPAVLGWYASGEDDDIDNGSERLPIISDGFSPDGGGGIAFASGRQGYSTERLLANSGTGTYGVGVALRDIKVIDSLSSTITALYIKGTNDADIMTEMLERGGFTNTAANKLTLFEDLGVGSFLTDEDDAFNVTMQNKYDIYENLAMYVDLGYIDLDLDNSTWGSSVTDKYDDAAWNFGITLSYSF